MCIPKILFLYCVNFYASLSQFYFCYPDPGPRFLNWIRIRTNDTLHTLLAYIRRDFILFASFFAQFTFLLQPAHSCPNHFSKS